MLQLGAIPHVARTPHMCCAAHACAAGSLLHSTLSHTMVWATAESAGRLHPACAALSVTLCKHRCESDIGRRRPHCHSLRWHTQSLVCGAAQGEPLLALPAAMMQPHWIAAASALNSATAVAAANNNNHRMKPGPAHAYARAHTHIHTQKHTRHRLPWASLLPCHTKPYESHKPQSKMNTLQANRSGVVQVVVCGKCHAPQKRWVHMQGKREREILQCHETHTCRVDHQCSPVASQTKQQNPPKKKAPTQTQHPCLLHLS